MRASAEVLLLPRTRDAERRESRRANGYEGPSIQASATALTAGVCRRIEVEFAGLKLRKLVAGGAMELLKAIGNWQTRHPSQSEGRAGERAARNAG
jgi:hypothetical protein